MTKKLHYSSFTAPILLAAAVLQACVGGHQAPAVLSVKTPAEAPSSTASTKVESFAAQPDEKYGSALQSGEQTPTPQSLVGSAAPMLQSTAASGGFSAGRQASLASPLVARQPLPVMSEGKAAEYFKLAAKETVIDTELPLPPLLAKANTVRLSQHTAESKQDTPHTGRQVPALSIDVLLKCLQNLDSHNISAWFNCLEAIAKTTSPLSADRVHSTLGQAYRKLRTAPKGAKMPQMLKPVLTLLETIVADLAHFQAMLGEEPASPSSTCLPVCQQSEGDFQVDFSRVGKIVKQYPAMAEAVVQKVLATYKSTLLYNEYAVLKFDDTKAEFIADCLMAYPAHTSKLLSIIRQAVCRSHVDPAIIEVLAQFVEKNLRYAKKSVSILSNAFYHPHHLVRIMALQACARILDKCPQCSRYVSNQDLCQAFESMQIALQEPELAMQASAQEALKQIEACKASFLRKEWRRYSRASNANQP